MNRRDRTPCRQQGLGLVEILIAIGLSALLLTGVLQIFLATKQAYRALETNARLQENGRFAIDFLSGDIRMAGYLGCFRNDFSTVENILNDATAFSWNLGTAIQGYEGTAGDWSPALPSLIAGRVRTDTDVIVVRSLAEDGIRLAEPYPPSGSAAGKFYVAANQNNIADGAIVMVGDCNRASIFQITSQLAGGGAIQLFYTNAGGFTPGNLAGQLSNGYGPDAELSRLRTYVYYVGTGTTGEPALFRSALVANGAMETQEMADGIENLQILYGEDTSGDGLANRYVTADQVGDLGRIISVRVSLLARSADNAASSPQAYGYDGAAVTPADLRVRRVFTTTIKLRNRGML